MAPTSINDQMGKSIVTTRCLAVHLEASFGLICGGCSGSLLETGTF